MFKDKKILITGITGSWGNELTKQLLQLGVREIIGYSRGELAQVTMKRKFNDNRLKFMIGDVRSLNRLNDAMRGVDIVFHLAALKHVPICEENPWESVNTNITGVENIIRSSIDNNVKLVVDVSTDKACNPLNMYGACKSVGEKLIISANNRSYTTRFVCVRAGNVIGSNGSVIPFFIERAKARKTLPITDFNMTRYLMTLPEAISLVLYAGAKSHGGEIFVTKMPAANILDVGVIIWEYYNGHIDIEFEDVFPEIGIRPGEKIHEMLVSEHESKYTVEDKYFRIILPMDDRLHDHYKNYPSMSSKEYTSNQELLDLNEIKELLVKSEFLK